MSFSNLRHSILSYVSARLISSILTVASMLLAARLMGLGDYGRYVAVLAMIEIGIAVSTMGCDWIITRWLPEYWINADRRTTTLFVVRSVGMQIAVLCCIGLGAGSIGLENFGLAVRQSESLQLALLVGGLLIVEGSGRIGRDQLLFSIGSQRHAQRAQILRSVIVFCGLLFGFLSGGHLTSENVLTLELGAALLAAIWAGLHVCKALSTKAGAATRESWQPPAAFQVRRLGRSAYLNYLLSLCYGPAVVTLILARLAGPEATATFGFARTLSDQVRRYLPTDLLQGLVRPMLVTALDRTGDYQVLRTSLLLLLKTSWLLALPVVVACTLTGEQLVRLLTGKSFTNISSVLGLLMAFAGSFAIRRVAEMAAHLTGHSKVLVLASLPMVLVPAVTWLALSFWPSPAPAALIVVAAELTYGLLALFRLFRLCPEVTFTNHSLWRFPVLVAAVLSIGVTSKHFLALSDQILLPLSLGLTLIGVLIMRPLDTTDIALIKNRLNGRSRTVVS